MTAAPRARTILIDPLDMEAAAAALCGRCGDAVAEAHRLVALREMLTTARGLSSALDEFTKQAGTHLQGIHCTAGMQGDVSHLASALGAWADAVQEAAYSYREWQDGAVAPRHHDDVTIVSHGTLASMYGAPDSAPLNVPPS
jgi:hypothetical protein